MARKRFPDDSLDYGERTYHHLILPEFPRYGEFWEEFIGGDYSHAQGTLLPYPLRFALGTSKAQRRSVIRKREIIRVSHYTLLTHLIAAHLSLDVLRRPAGTDQAFFEFGLALEAFYVHLGNAWYCYKDAFGNACFGMAHAGAGFLTHVDRDPRFKAQIRNFHGGPLRLRNNLVHFGRQAVLRAAGAAYIPLPIRKNPPWGSVLRQQQYARIDQLAAAHLAQTKRLFNDLHEEAGNLLRAGLRAHGAQVEYV